MSHSIAVTHTWQPASWSLEGLLVYKLKDLILRVSDSRSPGRVLGICVSVKPPGEVEVTDPDTTR